MNGMLWTLDLIFCVSLIWLAFQTLVTADLFKAIVLFIVFGLTLALSWARLDAPDIALAEAAIGAGLTGTLLLSTLAALSRPPMGAAASPLPRGSSPHQAGADQTVEDSRTVSDGEPDVKPGAEP